MEQNGSITASVTITNTGKYDGAEVAQLYIRDLVGSITRPVKELKGFEKFSSKPVKAKRSPLPSPPTCYASTTMLLIM